MTRQEWIRAALRVCGIAIALAAAIDPSVTSDRRSSATVAVIPADSVIDRELANRVAKSLGERFSVVKGDAAEANASVLVGDGIPRDEMTSPTFVVVPGATRARVEVLAVDAPRSTGLDARITTRAVVRAVNLRGATIDATLRAGDAALDRAARTVRRADDTLSIPLAFVPTATGAAALDVTVATGSLSASENLVVDVSDRKSPVLFYDARPSWGATFIRRAVEQDSRFVVVARTATSRNIASSIGAAAIRLNDPASIAAFDAIVVGAPDALTIDDVSGLEAFMRRRGGSVILIEEQRATAPIDRLTGVTSWNIAASEQPTAVALANDSLSWKATQLLWPVALPPAAEILASTANRPIIWRKPVGAGQLVVSGALDAWRFRDAEASGFEKAWPRLISDAAQASLLPIDAQLSRSVVDPGERVQIDGELRDATLSHDATPVAVGAVVDSVGAISLWPAGFGQVRGSFRAPRRPGLYRASLRANGQIRATTFRVAPSSHPSAQPPSVLSAWATSRGGSMVFEDSLDQLPDRILSRLRATPRIETWHPMRSIWWLLPFTLALSAEWWLRRRQGLR